ncbi:hypothetical protein [Oricola sp.]|uniref:hypothetical protein n=1 Tax=Oricola sp. TaxID=1979950 RepID=UPI0025F5A00E|nr:hypothetical protein [Oricola sp.]MCI5075627.1 hypothetical protein [Oricola sp.]
MKPNAIRKKAAKECADQEAARAMWRKVMDEFPDVGRRELDKGRLAMLTVIAEGGTIEDGASAAREVLS